MRRRRFHLTSAPEGSRAYLSGDEAHHLVRVLRARIGESIELMDGSGKVWRGSIADINPSSVEVTNLSLLTSEQPPAKRVILIQSLCKADKFEWILQKTTELGVVDIFVLIAERSVVKLPKDKITNKLERWKKIITGAAKQSRRSTIPALHSPADCTSFCQTFQADLKLVLSENEKEAGLKNLLRRAHWSSVAFCVGPEGGWTNHEEEVFALHGFMPVSLGPGILRTETAAIATMAILNYELEDS
jgi:16S rRNA (uracil1498-N3)-methyltransferase